MIIAERKPINEILDMVWCLLVVEPHGHGAERGKNDRLLLGQHRDSQWVRFHHPTVWLPDERVFVCTVQRLVILGHISL